MNITKESIIGQVVAADYRTASVFKSLNIDFCCNGNRTVEDAGLKGKIAVENLIESLKKAMTATADSTTDFQSWDMDLLADYIEKKHHRYVLHKIPELTTYLEKIAKVHGEKHPELLEIRDLFAGSSEELLKHMKKEENILFPYIRELANQEGRLVKEPAFGSVQNPIGMMMDDHENEGERFRKIAELSHDYTPPLDACNTYKVAFALLKEYEADLHLHIHLENNILFPKAVKAEMLLDV